MLKSVKKALIITIGVLLFGTMPRDVHAADFSFGTATKNENITKIPVVLEVSEGDVVKTAKIGCRTGHTDVTCEINVPNTSGFTGQKDTTGAVAFSYVGTDPNVLSAPANNYTIAELVLTNTSSTKITNMQVELKNANIEGVVKTLTVNTDVGAKAAPKVLSSDATLKSIKFSQGTMSPEFNPNHFEYTIYNIADTINSVRVTPTCNTTGCDFRLSGGKSISGMTVTLNQGENTISVEATSENGKNSQTYTFKVYRGETSYNSAKLSSLSFGDYTLTPSFDKDTKEYTMTVPNNVNSLVNIIKYDAEDKNAKVDVKGLDNLVVGTNTIKITVDNASGDETVTYTITVNRMSDENIEVIMYINNTVTFKDADGIQTELALEAFKEQYPKEYEKIMNGTYKFDEEGKIILEDTTQQEEDKNEEKKAGNKTWLIVLLVVIGLIIIGISGFFIFKKKPSKNDKKKKEDNDKNKTEDTDKDTEDKKTNENSEEEQEEIDEEGVEENIIGEKFNKNMDETVDIDEALSDLMSTKQYDFSKDLDD